MPVSAPGERWPFWSLAAGASVLWVTTSLVVGVGPQAASPSGLSSKRLAPSLAHRGAMPGVPGLCGDVLLQPIRTCRRGRDPAFLQQPHQQPHRHPDYVVRGPLDRADQAAALALYSVGTGLILRFTGLDVFGDRPIGKFTHRDMRPRNTGGVAERSPIDDVNRRVDLMRASAERAQEGGDYPAIPRLAEDPAAQHDVRVGADHDGARVAARHGFGL